jgi:hypothetical protein
MQRLARIERIEGVQEQFLERCAASGLEREYWRPEYALAVKAAEVFKVAFPEYENRQRTLKALNRTLSIYKTHKPRDNGVGYWTHIVDAALRNQDVEIEGALEVVDSVESAQRILSQQVVVDFRERLPIECTEADLSHDDIEDLGFSVEALAEVFNPKTAEMVRIMSKLRTDHFKGLSKEQLEHKLFSLQYFSLAYLMEGLVGKLRGDWRSNAATLKYKRGKNGVPDDIARQNTARGYLQRFGGIILEGQLEETHHALDECMRYGYPEEFERYERMRQRMSGDIEDAILQVDNFLGQIDPSKILHVRCSRPSLYHMLIREEKDRTTDPRILYSPTYYVECSSNAVVDDLKLMLEHVDLKRGRYSQEFVGRSSRLTTHDNSEVWVFRREGVIARFVLYTPDKAYLYEPMKNLVKEFRTPRQQEMREQLERVSRLYHEQFDADLPDEVLTQIISSEMGRRRILVGFNGNREVLLPAESSALDAYARVARTEGWDYRFVPTGYRVRYVYGDVEDTQNMMHGLYEGEHLDVAFEGDFVILPDLLRFNALRTFEGKLVMYKAAVRACKYYRSRRLKTSGFYESKRVMRAFEGLYGRNVRLLNG